MLGNYPIAPAIPSTDLKRSRDFYEGKLGLKVEKESIGGILFRAGENTKVYVYKRGPSKADHTLAGFEVPDLEAKVDEMTKNGIVFEQYDFPGLKTNEKGIATSEAEGERAAWFKDPDGNILSIGQSM